MEMQNNQVRVIGNIVSNPVFDHEVFGKKFYTMDLEVRF